MKPKLLVFDVDGTLVDSLSVSYDVDKKIISEFGGNVPSMETYRGCIGEGNWNDFYRKFGVNIDTERALELYYSRISQFDQKAIPGAKDLLQKLSDSDVARAIVSINKRQDYVLDKLRMAGLENYFTPKDIYCEGDNKVMAIKEACSKRGITPQAALYIGDTAKDVREARAAGLKTVAISNKFSFNTKDIIMQSNPDYLFTDISDLTSFLEGKDESY